MTTIAYKDGKVVSDTKVSGLGQCTRIKIKHVTVKSKHGIFGLCGDLSHCYLFEKFFLLNSKEAKDKLEGLEKPEYLAVFIEEDGTVYEYSNSTTPAVYTTHVAAWGSGAEFALGAMYAGKSAKEAIQLTSKLDHCTGYETTVLSFKQ